MSDELWERKIFDLSTPYIMEDLVQCLLLAAAETWWWKKKTAFFPPICLDVISIPQLNAGQNLQHISPTFFPIIFNPLLTKLSYKHRYNQTITPSLN